MPTRLWLRLEADYHATRHRLRTNVDVGESASWLREIPVTELVKRGIIPGKPNDQISRTQQLLAFFGVAHISSYRELYENPQPPSGRQRRLQHEGLLITASATGFDRRSTSPHATRADGFGRFTGPYLRRGDGTTAELSGASFRPTETPGQGRNGPE
jgi:hypothetical protein